MEKAKAIVELTKKKNPILDWRSGSSAVDEITSQIKCSHWSRGQDIFFLLTYWDKYGLFTTLIYFISFKLQHALYFMLNDGYLSVVKRKA